MPRYQPAKKNWCNYCSALVVIDRERQQLLKKVWETIRCTRCGETILVNEISLQMASEKYRSDYVSVPDMSLMKPDTEMVDLVNKSKVRTR